MKQENVQALLTSQFSTMSRYKIKRMIQFPNPIAIHNMLIFLAWFPAIAKIVLVPCSLLIPLVLFPVIGKSVLVPCKSGGCRCKGYKWVPSKPEEVGEFWFQRRRNFDVSTWRAKCRCKHGHDEHDPTRLRRCRSECNNLF